jgi:hypothetical protein
VLGQIAEEELNPVGIRIGYFPHLLAGGFISFAPLKLQNFPVENLHLVSRTVGTLAAPLNTDAAGNEFQWFHFRWRYFVEQGDLLTINICLLLNPNG